MPAGGGKGDELIYRTASALVLVAVALVVTYLGGVHFTVLWTLAGIAILYEWAGMARLGRRWAWFAIGAVALVAAQALLFLGERPFALGVMLIGAALGALVVPRQATSALSGILAAGAVALPVVVLRDSATHGLLVVLYLYAVVWATDVAAYFVGRRLGGPKLAPLVSPNKTWSGAVGGALAGALAGTVVALAGRLSDLLVLALLALVLSVGAQAGDLAESAAKRRFGVKDASHLIPGHGGLLDRLDGFAAAALLALLIAELRGALDPAAGLLLW